MGRFLKRCCLKLLMLPPALAVALLICFGALDAWTDSVAGPHCHKAAADCRAGDVAVVLGCTPSIKGRRNKYFTGRMDAAAELWKAGKVRCVIVSGDNRQKYYNEPRYMTEALVSRGVPREKIVPDYAGLRTYDSVVRADRIFGVKKVTFVSQPDHVERAVTMARALGMDAEGLEAPDRVVRRSIRLKQWLRERAARAAMFLDVVTHHEPRHLGERIALPE